MKYPFANRKGRDRVTWERSGGIMVGGLVWLFKPWPQGGVQTPSGIWGLRVWHTSEGCLPFHHPQWTCWNQQWEALSVGLCLILSMGFPRVVNRSIRDPPDYCLLIKEDMEKWPCLPFCGNFQWGWGVYLSLCLLLPGCTPTVGVHTPPTGRLPYAWLHSASLSDWAIQIRYQQSND